MHIQKVHIVGLRCFKDITIEFNKDKNIIVGDNGTGKSTILDAIHMCLRGQHRGQPINNSLSPFLFNKDNVKTYLDACQTGGGHFGLLPQITIEVFLSGNSDDDTMLAFLEGNYNINKEDGCSGIRLDIMFNDEFRDEYEALSRNSKEIKSIPIEYYYCVRQTFARSQITYRSIPIRSQLIDTSAIVNHRGTTDLYLNRMINDRLDVKDRVALSGAFRQMKEDFASNKALDEIVEKINTAEDELSLAIDPSVSANWESLLIAKVSDVPFYYIGKGDQCMTKTHLVLDSRNKEACVLLLEEPENHLSYGRLHKFISQIERKNATSQIIMTTHSSMVCNKLDLGNLILLGRNETPAYFKRLDEDTRKFFQKVSGFDTLRVVLSPRSILVEGPSDDLILQKAYYLAYEHMPIEDGVDIISVSGLSFKRYASIVQCINNKVAIVTDNDGIAEKKEIRYAKYRNNNMKFFFSHNNSLKTLEPQIVEANKSNLSVLTHILGISEDDKITEDYLVNYMQKHKTDSALAIFETDEKVNMPEYIEEAIRWIKTDS
jgi:hypothetical protein